VSDRATSLFEFSHSASATRPFRAMTRRLAIMLETRRTRHILAELDPRQLKDIGISRGEAQAEVARAPWEVGPR
jgi:uncharacterized protein YjiS (DUF1127 family)